jgi:hypothetical protein
MAIIFEIIFRPLIFWTLWAILLTISIITAYLAQLDEKKRAKELKSIKSQLKDSLLMNEELAQKLKTTNFKNASVNLETSLDSESGIDIKSLIVSFAIEVWRLEKRVNQAKSLLKDNEDSDSLQDQLQRIKDVLAKQDIEIQESTGSIYNDGMSLKVLHVEEADNLQKGTMQIIETVKPSVFLKGEVISHGEIIVGKPKNR